MKFCSESGWAPCLRQAESGGAADAFLAAGYWAGVGGARIALIVPIAKVERNKNVPGFDISNSRVSLNFPAPGGHLNEVAFRNPVVLGVRLGNLNEHLRSGGVQFRHSAGL